MRKFILDDDGNPVACDDILEWGRWLAKSDVVRVVAQEHIGDVFVSTVFLGMDHSWGPGGSAPILWETMIFGGEHDKYMDRYTSRADADKGHADAIAMVKGS
jgi:hypothetical protein